MSKIHISELKKGDVVFECSQYGSIEVRVDSPVKFKDGKWTFKGSTPDGKTDFLVTQGMEHYGPRFYDEPIYFPVERFKETA